jgi:DNA-directed RNA polymerase subunit RPC12/RpoP
MRPEDKIKIRCPECGAPSRLLFSSDKLPNAVRAPRSGNEGNFECTKCGYKFLAMLPPGVINWTGEAVEKIVARLVEEN